MYYKNHLFKTTVLAWDSRDIDNSLKKSSCFWNYVASIVYTMPGWSDTYDLDLCFSWYIVRETIYFFKRAKNYGGGVLNLPKLAGLGYFFEILVSNKTIHYLAIIAI